MADDNTNSANNSGNQKGDQVFFTIPPHPNTKFDEENFLKLLEGSISLSMEEKQKVIDAIPRLSIEQINELIKIFEEEKKKFAELEKEYSDDVVKLKEQRQQEMINAKSKEENQAEENLQANKDEAAAEELRKKLKGDNK